MEIQRLPLEDVARFREIRLRSLRDAPASFGTTYQEAATWPHDVWVELFSGITVFVALEGDTDIGMVRATPERESENTASLGSLWVSPETRGKEVGAALIDAVVEWARSKGFVALFLSVNDDNSSAIAFYSCKGFKRTGLVGALPPPREHLGKHQRVLKL